MKNKKGFTFVELIIALTIFAIIALGIYSTFSTGLTTYKRSEGAGRLQQEARWALDRMAKELRDAVIYNFGADEEESSFSGERDKISFLSLVYDPSAKVSQIKRISYSLEIPDYGEVRKTIIGETVSELDKVTVFSEEEGDVLNSLQRREETLEQTLQINQGPTVASESLTDLVKPEGLTFSFAFAQAAGEEEGTIGWRDIWEDKTKLPRGVKITLILQNPKNPADEAIFTKTVFLEQGEIGQQQ